MSKNTNIAELINYISVDGSGNVVLSSGQLIATQNFVSTAITNLVNSAPSTLDTLNELAAALGNDANFATTVSTSIGNRVPYTGANADVVLGSNNLKSKNTFVEGDGLYNGGGLRIKQYAFQTDGIDGYNTISSQTSGFAFSSSRGNGVFNNFILDPTSLPNNTQRSYILPNANGTLALTSDIPTVSGVYVPYTGATANVSLGNYELGAKYITSEGSSGLGGVVNIKQDAISMPKGNGYSSIGANLSSFDFWAYTGASTYKYFQLRFDGLTNGTTRLYTLPNADGTLALTSNLSAYLPLSGGTLTGALNGTSATFNVSRTNGANANAITLSDNVTGVSTAGFGLRLLGTSNGGSVISAIGFENGGTGTNNESQLSFYTQNVAGSLTRQLLITSTGVANFSNRIEIISNGGTNPVLAIRQTNAANQGYDFETEDVSVGRLDLYGVTHTGRVHTMSWIKSTGNVGIGTLSPYSNAKLQVRTGTNINLAFQTGTTDSSGVKLNAFNDAANTNIPFELNGSILYFKVAESERMRLTTTGPTTMGCLLVNKTTASSSYTIQTTSTNGAFMASATGPGDANYYSTSPTIGYHIYGDQGGVAKFNVTGGGKGYFAAGVQFGSGSSTLNYYQEGTWTPQLYAGSSAFTMSGINEGKYVRIGNQVTVTGHLQWSSGSGSGMVRISGLPFACTGVRSAGSMGAVSYGLSFNAGYNHWVLVIDPGADFIYIIQGDASGGGYSHTPPVGGSGIVYGFSITYHIL